MKKRFILTALFGLGAASLAFGNVSYASEEGEKEITSSEDKDMVYGIGSVSKVYVTTAVMQLVDQGKVELDAPVTDYIDDFEMADERYKDITVKMLMNHTSGIKGTTSENLFLYGDNDFDAPENILENLKTQTLKADPGEYAAYCNDGFELLEIIVERVSGMSYTEYVEKNIVAKIGAESIYTGESVYENDALADVYPDGRNRYETEYVMGFGTGGIYSTAVDTCEFGSTFFKGDNRLLSEESKDAMATLWSDNTGTSKTAKYDAECLDQCGLGWDLVNIPMYEEAGVKAVYKGGDSMQYHASLLVMPEEEISVSVNTAGGGSEFNLAMAEALANIVLEEQGIMVEETTAPEVTLDTEVPDSYKKYEGLYTLNGFPAMVSFPEMKYMKVEMLGSGTSVSYYLYSDRGFIKATGDVENGNGRIDKDYVSADIVEVDGTVYVIQELLTNDSGLISAYQKSYIGEMLELNPVSDEVLKAWQERDGEKYEFISEKYSSALYDAPFAEVSLLDETGYAMYTFLGEARILKIVDENHLEAFATIPSSANRDSIDFETDAAGVVHSSNEIDMISMSENESFTADIKEVSLQTGNAKWFNIDESMANKTISLDRPENSAVYVYDKYGEVSYSTHMIDYGNLIHLPKDGYIMFAGEDGGTIDIQFSE